MNFHYEPERIFALNSSGETIAEVTFPIHDNIAVINHTFVDDSLRGQGIANELLSAAAHQIRTCGLKAKPTCSYAIKWFREHPENNDIL